ncbi:MAG: YraN family protein [Bacteroidales bacterium]|nr:YraN family protein [Bacteroidales bacterium]
MAQHNALGAAGEAAAALYLAQQGYTLHERNWRSHHYEIDLIAEWHGTLVFVEVKTRSSASFGQPYEAVDDAKEHRLVRAAHHYCLSKAHQGPWRVDILSLVGTPKHFEITHIKNVATHNVYGLPYTTR